ncbi:MAG: DUF1524 domain-containing protein, partial [Actinomycetota bacterium]|nr:DUF1524 domain-containing protein [Actinomycetota bacterium]
VLEAAEDHRRGWHGTAEGLGGERVGRGKYHIEHVMPRKWQMNWPLPAGTSELDRDRLVHTIGNLTLLTGKLNSKVSNSAWTSKRAALAEHDVLKVNSDLLATAGETWTEDQIRTRSQSLIGAIVSIWPVPEGHKSTFAKTDDRPREKVDVAALIGAGLIEPGATLWARRKAKSDRTATVLPDGRIDVDGTAFQTPSGAAKHVSGKGENGWWYFLVDPASRRSLSDLFHEYVDQTSADVDESEAGEDDEDDDS